MGHEMTSTDWANRRWMIQRREDLRKIRQSIDEVKVRIAVKQNGTVPAQMATALDRIHGDLEIAHSAIVKAEER